MSIYIVYGINLWNCVESCDPKLENYLFGAAKLIKKVLILANVSILDMVLDLIQKQLFHFLMTDLIKM